MNTNYNSNRNKSYAPRPENKAKYNPNYRTRNKPQSSSTYKFGNTSSNNSKSNSRISAPNKSQAFFDAMERTVNSCYNFSRTENGAIGHSTTGSSLLNMNFKLASYRNTSTETIEKDFIKAFNENPIYALKALFYFRDVREGQGERRFFRTCITSLSKNGQTILIRELLPLMAEYGRWDDILVLLETPSKKDTLKLISKQWNEDMDNLANNKPISLMGKWLPSCQASSEVSKKRAGVINRSLKLSARNYRRGLSALREHIRVVERQMSSQNWESIDYEAVPSKANLLYSKAFLRHDTDRRVAYLNALKTGEAKINSSVVYPHDITLKYRNATYWGQYREDDTLEAMWNALPDVVPADNRTIVVADGSGSMSCHRIDPKSNATPLDVANAMAIYFAERSVGAFHNRYITFSTTPQLVHLNGDSLAENLTIAARHNEIADTNIEAVYDLILNTAIRNRMKQDELPKNILVISDMEFNGCVQSNSGMATKTLFDHIKTKFKAAGYLMPKTIFWNVASRSNTIPMTENEMGCILVSGFSINTIKMVMSVQLDPYAALIETLDSERYDAVGDAVKRAMVEYAKAMKKYESAKPKNERSYNGNNLSKNGQRVRREINSYKARG